jgi:hypothetical protein
MARRLEDLLRAAGNGELRAAYRAAVEGLDAVLYRLAMLGALGSPKPAQRQVQTSVTTSPPPAPKGTTPASGDGEAFCCAAVGQEAVHGGRRSPAGCPAHRVAAEGRAAWLLGAASGDMEGRMSEPGAPSLQRYPSTADTAPPTPGAWCSSCFGIRWWTERHGPKGLRCATCHSPDHLKPEQVRWEPEPEPSGPLL